MWGMLGLAAAEGLTVRDYIADLPHDAASIVGYVFIAAFLFFVALGLRGSRPRGPAQGG
jgi:hypothetical protein